MPVYVKTTTVYKTSLERAFKTPMLCDITKVHTGFGFTPKVTHSSEDENWGEIGFKKKIHTAPTFLLKGGWTSTDKVLQRVENSYWKIEVGEFQTYMFGFLKLIGEWKTTELKPNEVLIEYSYTLHSKHSIFFPFHWLFAKTFWKMYMKNVLKNIRTLIKNKEAYLFE